MYCVGNPIIFIDKDGRQISIPMPVPYVAPILVNGNRQANRPTITDRQLKQDVHTAISIITIATIIPADHIISNLVVLNSGKSPGLKNQEKNDRDGKNALDKNQANVATAIKENIPDPQSNGDSDPKKSVKEIGIVGTVILVGLKVAELGENLYNVFKVTPANIPTPASAPTPAPAPAPAPVPAPTQQWKLF